MYGAPLGTLYSGVLDYFNKLSNELLDEALEKAQTPGAGLPATPPGVLNKTTRDSNGIAYPPVATAFRLFGLHAWANFHRNCLFTEPIAKRFDVACIMSRDFLGHRGRIIIDIGGVSGDIDPGQLDFRQREPSGHLIEAFL